MTTYLHEDPRVAATVERQLQQSALRREMGERAATQWRVDQPAACRIRQVTISREAGAGGGEVAALWAGTSAGRSLTRISWTRWPSASTSRD